MLKIKETMYYNELWNITPEENTLPSKLDINCLAGFEPKMNIINITQLYFFREYHNEVRWTCKSIRIIKMVGQTFKLTLDSYRLTSPSYSIMIFSEEIQLSNVDYIHLRFQTSQTIDI